jgi:hypothetical protein
MRSKGSAKEITPASPQIDDVPRTDFLMTTIAQKDRELYQLASSLMARMTAASRIFFCFNRSGVCWALRLDSMEGEKDERYEISGPLVLPQVRAHAHFSLILNCGFLEISDFLSKACKLHALTQGLSLHCFRRWTAFDCCSPALAPRMPHRFYGLLISALRPRG